MQANTQQADFFKTRLIPAAQVMEVLMANTAYAKRHYVGSQFMEPLNLVSAYVLSTGVAAGLDDCITTLIDAVLECLSPVNKSPVRQDDKNRFEVNLKDLAFVAEPAIKGMLKAIDYMPTQRGFWLARHMPMLRAKGITSQNWWRTFVRNLHFRRNMDALGISVAAGCVGRLGSSQGEERLENLWEATFGVALTHESPKVQVAAKSPVAPSPVVVAPAPVAPVREEKREVQPLPNDVSIELDAHRRIKVKAAFYPRSHLKVVGGTPTPKLSVSLATALENRYWEELCDATSFANAVANANNWVAMQKEGVSALQAQYDDATEELQMQALTNRLQQSFNTHEISLLKKLFAGRN